MDWYWQVDGWMVIAGSLCAMACALVGNFLVLRRLSLIGDAISHAVLPGIAAAFFWSGSRSQLAAVIGSAILGVATVWLTEFIRRYGRVEESAAIGVVFTALFALGLMMIARADHVDLDPSCVLYGNLETIILDTRSTPLGEIPTVVIELGCIFLFNLVLTTAFFRQWTLSTFDPTMAEAQGISPTFFHYLLAAMTAVTCIVSFRAVGNILVVAMLIVPSSIAYLCCNRLSSMMRASLVIAVLVACLGHVASVVIPHAMGFKSANSAAMMAVVSGVLLTIAMVFSPKAGMVAKWFSRRRLARRILGEDILALLYRDRETHGEEPGGLAQIEIADRLKRAPQRVASVIADLMRYGFVVGSRSGWSLSAEGQRHAQNLVRSHRQWEQFLSVEAGVSDRRLHAQAESLEHYTNSDMRGELDRIIGSSSTDPHGKRIPPESR